MVAFLFDKNANGLMAYGLVIAGRSVENGPWFSLAARQRKPIIRCFLSGSAVLPCTKLLFFSALFERYIATFFHVSHCFG
jgi:hypothetical protein